MNWFLIPLTAFLAIALWTVTAIAANYAIARRINFPIIVSPVSTLNPFWIILYRIFPPVLQLKHLPLGLGTWARCTYMGWQFDDKYALHSLLGPIFTIVTPGGNEIIVANPSATHTILAKRKDFIKPAIMYDQLNVFGPNVNTVEGDDWQRQRKLTAPKFNEKISEKVWEETMRQAGQMIEEWTSAGGKGTKEVVRDTATVALHVLTAVGFGVIYPFHGGLGELHDRKGHTMSYREALQVCLRNIITFSILPRPVLEKSWMPRGLRRVGQAAREFQQYMSELLATEKARQGGEANLMSALVHAQEGADENGMEKSTATSVKLRDDEIFGNIFAFNLAGHETTANTVAAAIVLLATFPKYQQWLAEEIDRVDPSANGYDTSFPKLKRCLAVMYETLRLYGSIVFIPKTSGFHTQTITLEGTTHVLPPGTAVILNVQALHTDDKTWGDDALVWRPDRWLQEDSSAPGPGESFIEPRQGSFIPWADGPRVCLGRKFSQVEFVATLARLFGQYQVRPAIDGSASAEDARKACQGMVDDSAITAITLQMRNSKRVALVWERRSSIL